MATSVTKLPGQPFTISWEMSAEDQVLLAHWVIEATALDTENWQPITNPFPANDRTFVSVTPTVTKNYRVVSVSPSGLKSYSDSVQVAVDDVPPPTAINVQVS